MLDCGIHPGRTGDDALPFFDSGPDASEIDLILISHFHLGRCVCVCVCLCLCFFGGWG